MRVVLDAYGLIKWLLEEPGYKIVENYLSSHEVWMNLINFGEIYYRLIKNGLQDEAHSLWSVRERLPINYVEANWTRIKEAAEIKANYPVSYADAFCMALGIEKNAPIVTGDPEFRKVEKIKLIWIGD